MPMVKSYNKWPKKVIGRRGKLETIYYLCTFKNNHDNLWT